MKKKYLIRLTETERQDLRVLVRKGKAAAYRRTHAQILLLADESEAGSGLRDAEIAARVEVNERTVSRLRQRCVEQGLEAALERQARQRERSRVLDGEGEAQLIKLACSEPSEGRARWTLQMLCEALEKKKVVLSISYETVRQVLKKTLSNPGNRKCGVFHRKKMPPSCVRWSRCLRSTNAPMTQRNRWCVWTKPASNV